jgi:hypothetical protein
MVEEKSTIKVTYNEACVLQNQVITEFKRNIIFIFYVRIFELNSMIKEI